MATLSRTFDLLAPTRLAVAATGFTAVIICLLANARTVLDRYGLDDSSRYIGQNANQRFLHFLSTLDSFRLTASIVTFMVWAVVGLVCLGTIQTLLAIRSGMIGEREFTSNGYAHPVGFSARRLHREIFWSIFRTFLTAALVIGSFLLLLGVLVPLARLYQTPAIDRPDLVNIAFLLFGFVLIWAGTILTYVASRAFFLRNRLT